MNFFVEVLSAIFGGSGFAALPTDWRQVIMIAIAVSVVLLAVDIVYAYMDPRVKAQYVKN